MDIQAYISSGVLEAYVSGTATEKEQREVACLSKIHPEIAAELEALEQTMVAYAQANSVQPPAFIREKILSNIESAEVIPIGSGTAVTPTVSAPRQGQGWRIAAAIALLVAGGFITLFFQSRNDIGALQQQLAGSMRIERPCRQK